MKKRHLFWIIPLMILSGMVTYAIFDNVAEESVFKILDTCLAYEYDMDMAILLVQKHCLTDLITGNYNLEFCLALQGKEEDDRGILQYYHFKEGEGLTCFEDCKVEVK